MPDRKADLIGRFQKLPPDQDQHDRQKVWEDNFDSGLVCAGGDVKKYYNNFDVGVRH